MVPRARLRGKTRDFNWHNAIGFWSAPVLFILVLTGVTLSYSWAGNLLYRLTGTEPPPARSVAQRPGSPRESIVIPTEIDRLWTIASERVPDWKTINVRFETSPAAPLTFSIERGYRGRPDLRSQLTLDPTDRRSRALGAVFELQSRPPTPLLGALRPHGRSGRRGWANSCRSRLRGCGRAGLDRLRAGLAPLPGTQTPEPAHSCF